MKKLFLLTAIFGFMLNSCADHDRDMDSDTGSKGQFKLTVTAQGFGTEIATRATVAPETGEDQLQSLYLMFFDSSETFADYIEVTGTLTMNTTISLSIPTGSAINTSDAYTILAVANMTESNYLGGLTIDEWMLQWAGKTLEYVRLSAFASVSGSTTNDSNAILPSQILMNGTTTKAAGSGSISLTLTRNVARFDVYNSVSDDYEIASVSVWNAYPTSSLFGDGVLDYSTSATRIRRFYGIDNTGGSQNIAGGLYAFENKVAAPSANDQLTTTLIIGLRNVSTNTVSYYRANVSANNTPQNLKRNNVYRVTITSVYSDGADSEDNAYTSIDKNISYVINYWDLDDNGLIVADEYSLLAIPVKTINIGSAAGTNEYTITTFSTLDSPAALSIKSQTYTPSTSDIQATLSGNTLIVNYTQLAAGSEERNGIITLSYAGLEATINVFQSSSVDMFLYLTLPDEGITAFPATEGVSSGAVTVNASSSWTAKILMEGFSFSSSSNVTTITSDDAANVTDDRFRLWTYSANENTYMREAYVVVTLDEDPINYAAVIVLHQKAAGGLSVSPSQSTVTFNGLGTGLASVSDNTTNTFNVYPSTQTVEGSSDVTIDPWSYMLISYDDTNDDTGMFTISATTSTSDTSGNTITVNPVGENLSGRSYQAWMRIYLTDDNTVYTDILVVQQSYQIETSPNTFTTLVAAAGGQSDLIEVLGESTMQWYANIETATTTSGVELTNHGASLVDSNGNTITAGSSQSMSTQFRVQFPKVYFPNRERTVVAYVTVGIVGTNLTRTLTISQNGIYNSGVNVWSSSSLYYGAINNGYFKGYSDALTATGINLSTSYVSSGTTATNYAHMANASMTVSSYDWSTVNTFRSAKDAITVILGDEYATYPVNALNSSTSPLGSNGYTINGSGNLSTTVYSVMNTDSDVTATRIYQFLTTHGATAVDPTSIASFFTDGVRTEASAWPSTAVPIVVSGSNSARAIMLIDMTNSLVYIGEGQIFYNTTYLTNNRSVFMNNFIQYVRNAAMYGSHFTDLLREDLNLPEPWSDTWGSNKWESQ